jgi:hypothetical protein
MDTSDFSFERSGLSTAIDETTGLIRRSNPVPPVWDLLYDFQARCIERGWTPYNLGDLIEAEGVFHKFFWIRGLYVSTFRAITARPRCTFHEGHQHQTVAPRFLAWVLPVTPPTLLWLHLLKDAPKLTQTVALYDLSPVYAGEGAGVKLNETSSHVFQVFERYLQDRYQIRFTALTGPRPVPLTQIIPPHDAAMLR